MSIILIWVIHRFETKVKSKFQAFSNDKSVFSNKKLIYLHMIKNDF